MRYASLALLVALVFFLWPRSIAPSAPTSEGTKRHATKPVEATPIATAKSLARAPAAAAPHAPSLEALTETVARALRAPANLRDLLERLKASGQEPFVVRDQNPDTGEMLVVRTRAPLSGTRYFHAQYFTDESGEPFVQHVSYEFEPGPESMNNAIASVERNFTNLSRPVVQREGYVKWKMGDDYIVWVKRMEPEDLRDDPFNAYSARDEGTVRVAVELEIHGD